MQEVIILGSTGTIGVNTLNVIAQHKGKFKVKALTSNSNAELLAKQAQEFGAEFVAIADESKYQELKNLLPNVNISAGDEAISELAGQGADIVISAIMGFAALRPTMSAIKSGAKIGLANKESLVCAGELMMQRAKDFGAEIIPIDSEHNGLFQILEAGAKKIVLTASGGPFRTMPIAELANVTPEMAVKHPNWKMGRKISVDSATMMNKGLELIEAKYLFGLDADKLGAIIHPESYIHALVYLHDGSVLMQASEPDMRVPISYALGYPDRLENSVADLDLGKVAQLNFEELDYARYPCLKIAEDAMAAGGAMPIVLNAANEIAVDKFLNNQIKFTEIASLVERVLAASDNQKIVKLADVFEVDKETRKLTNAMLAE